MAWAKVLRSGQVTLPKEIRTSLNIKEGDILDFELKDSLLIVRPKTFVDSDKVDLWKMVDRMHEKLKDEDPNKIEREIREAIKEVRKERAAGKQPKR